MSRPPGQIREDPAVTSVQFEAFRWGPVAIGAYRALIASGLLLLAAVPAFGIHWLFIWLGLLVLGPMLRPILVTTGLYRGWLIVNDATDHALHGDLYRKRREAVEREQRRLRLKRQRSKHPDLPKNW